MRLPVLLCLTVAVRHNNVLCHHLTVLVHSFGIDAVDPALDKHEARV